MLPREKTLKYGISSLTNIELLALILKTGPRGSIVLQLAEELTQRANGFANLFTLTYEELIAIPGIGQAKSLEILAILEIAKRLSSVDKVCESDLDSPQKIAEWLRFQIGFSDQEEFMVLFLSNAGDIIKHEVLFKGSKNTSIVAPDEILRRAIRYKAARIVICHNHPSNNVRPSSADIDATRNLKNACKLLSIPLLDHIIVSKTDYFSFKQHKLI